MTGHLMYRNLRQCQNCGYTAECRYNNHKVWNAEEGRPVYCGYMRVVKNG